VLPDITPTKGEIDKRVATPSITTGADASCEWKFVPRLISPLEGEMSGRTEGGNRHALRGQTHAH
ncbi:hypothetical protein, partial [Rhizobium oryzihabitans]|uniref:hypothetical protein n=1 Tax=Rhizobium oryzihabitans TaxID=2267833 RepID=UPI0040364FEB